MKSYLEGRMCIRFVDTTNRSDVRRFIQFPFDLYKDCPLWVPPFISDMTFVMKKKKHPFYTHSEAVFLLVPTVSDSCNKGKYAFDEEQTNRTITIFSETMNKTITLIIHDNGTKATLTFLI